MKENFFIQAEHGEQDITFFKNEAKKSWKSAGNMVKDIDSLDLYIKPHENKCYYLINKDFSGSVDLF